MTHDPLNNTPDSGARAQRETSHVDENKMLDYTRRLTKTNLNMTLNSAVKGISKAALFAIHHSGYELNVHSKE